ncbi:MAG: histidine kinase [Treponema sp.]|nr:histidine kinase [Treponema sp.]
MQEKQRFTTFRSGLYRIFFLSILFPSLVFAAFFSMYYIRTLSRERKKSASYLLSEVSSEIKGIFDSMHTVADSCYTLPDTISAITYFDNPELQYDALRIQQFKMNYEIAMYRLLLNRQEEFEAAAFFPANTGRPCYITSRISGGLVVNTKYDYRDCEWYKKTQMENKSFFIFHENPPEYLNYSGNFPIISEIVPIKSLETNNQLGIMKIDVRSSRFSDILKKIPIPSDDFLLIRDTAGTTVCESSSLNVYARESLASNASFKGYSTYSVRIPDTDWNLYYLESNNIIITIIALTLLFVAAIVATEVFLGLAEYRRHSIHLLHDFDRIETTLIEYELGNLSYRAGKSENAELNRCIDALNQLGKTLDSKIRNEYLAVIARQKAEYNALQAQINPHFFYNMLNEFIALNRMGETEKLEQSILNLTTLFRYTCCGGNTTTVKEEFKFVQNYLTLEQIKYEERLSFSISVSPDAENCIIPKLILQPLAENSIKHGVEPVARPVRIEISAVVCKENGKQTLVLTVSDDGAGCSPLLQEDLFSGKEHVALANIRNRVSLFRDSSSVEFHCAIDKGMRVSILIPEEGTAHDNTDRR